MKRIVLSIVSAAIILIIVASPVALGAETRIAVMDLEAVINESRAGKEANAELTALIEKRQAEVDEKGVPVEQLAQELEEQSESMTEEEKQAKQEELEQLIGDYEQAVMDAEAEIQARADELRNQMLREIGQVLQEIAQQDDYILILDTSMVHYYSRVIDITYEVIRKYDVLTAQ